MKVVYNGSNGIGYRTSSPNRLVVGHTYTVADIRDFGIYQHYIFEEIEGEYETSWFSVLKYVGLAFSKEPPKLNTLYECSVAPEMNKITIIPRRIFPIGIDTYYVEVGVRADYVIQISK